MKILVLGFAKLKIMPYMNFYLENIDRKKNDVHLLYWNRDLKKEDQIKYTDLTFHEFKYYQEDEVKKWQKVKSFCAYRKFALNVIDSYQFDFIIVLHSLPGLLVLDRLVNKYSGKFILDYRDSTYETFYPFKKLVNVLIKHSKCTFTSSDAFRIYFSSKYLYKIFTSHNILNDALNHREYKRVKSSKIRVAFWGMIRHEEINKILIDRLGNDLRFELHYYGREQNIALALKEYVSKNKYTNIFFHGEYNPEDRYEFVKYTDIIHNIYLDTNTQLAMGNKFYDGIIFRIPQVCMVESYMGTLCQKFGIGVAINPNLQNFADLLYDYYSALDMKTFDVNADEVLQKVLGEYNAGVNLIKDIFI